MADRRISTGTLTDIADAIRAKTGKSASMTPAEMVTEIAAISSGTTITDGIVITSRDSNLYPLTAEMYCASGIAPPNQFFPGYAATSWNYYTSGYWKNLETLTVKNKISALKAQSFSYLKADIVGDFSEVSIMPGDQNTADQGTDVFSVSGVRNLRFDNLSYFTGKNLNSCSKLETLYAPKCVAIWNKWDAGASRATFGKCIALENVQLGSVGYSCVLQNDQAFIGCTQTGLTITLYTTGANVDTQVTRIRNGATNATIVIKASEQTEYNGTTYAAGETILTSEVTS